MENQRQQEPTKCVNGCGFFGNPQSENYCSKCYRERQQTHQKAQPQVTVNQPEPPRQEVIPSVESKPQETAPVVKQEDTSKCWTCKKKVGLLGFRCKCDFVFCSTHRYADQHVCTFDWKGANQQKLAKENPTVVAAKIQKF